MAPFRTGVLTAPTVALRLAPAPSARSPMSGASWRRRGRPRVRMRKAYPVLSGSSLRAVPGQHAATRCHPTSAGRSSTSVRVPGRGVRGGRSGVGRWQAASRGYQRVEAPAARSGSRGWGSNG
jgi:hypothetical protein